jgi:hypothetical protein
MGSRRLALMPMTKRKEEICNPLSDEESKEYFKVFFPVLLMR